MNLPALLTETSSLPPTVARRARFNFTVSGCLAFCCIFVVLLGCRLLPIR